MDAGKKEEFLNLEKEALLGGGSDKLEKIKQSGLLTARERIERLLDLGSFIEFDKYVVHKATRFEMDKKKILGDGVITGVGKINGERVCLYSQDSSCWGGALGAAHAKKICKIMDFAVEHNLKIIGINDSGGARIQEGVESLAGYAEIFYRNVNASGVVPQISLIMGPCAGGAVYSPAITDFIFMVENSSYMFVTGPDVIKAVTHESVTKEELGGAATHNTKSGVAHFSCQDELACLEKVRELIAYIPTSNDKASRKIPTYDPIDRKNTHLEDLIPDSPKKPYDMKKLIYEVIDDGHFVEVHRDYAQNIICGFASFAGIKVGIVANQPQYLAGTLDINSSVKAARFIRFCDAFEIPIVSFVDVPGFLPGTIQEYGGIIKHGAKLLYAYAEATVPLVTLITRKAYGGAYDVMASKHLRSDINLAYPTGEIAVMGAEGAVNIIFRKDLVGLNAEKQNERRKGLVDAYEKEFSNPYIAAELGYLDEVILPEDTRFKICHYLEFIKDKRKMRANRKHGNIPL